MIVSSVSTEAGKGRCLSDEGTGAGEGQMISDTGTTCNEQQETYGMVRSGHRTTQYQTFAWNTSEWQNVICTHIKGIPITD